MTKEEQFVNELIGYIFAYPDDDYMTMECLCRKLHKYGLIDKKDGEWTIDFIERKTEPSIDIVRCRDCKWAEPNEEGDYDCKCHIPTFRIKADGFCSYGEREGE